MAGNLKKIFQIVTVSFLNFKEEVMLKRLFLCASLCVVTAAQANSIDLSLDGGVNFSRISDTQQLEIASGLTNNYANDSATTTRPMWGGNISCLWTHLANKPFDFGLGLGAYDLHAAFFGTETQAISLGGSSTW